MDEKITIYAADWGLAFGRGEKSLPVSAICNGRGGKGWKLYGEKSGRVGPDVSDVVYNNDKLRAAVEDFLAGEK